ncbi:MAG TPA: TrbI/VirB10 family protein [Terriglobales bacterium]|nr:TrbI/VirB10 family protein [Terriglobales bacterium]
MHNDGISSETNLASHMQAQDSANATEEAEAENIGKPGWRESFRIAFDRARRQQKPIENRKELARDKSKSFFVLAAVAVVLLLVFFGVFSSPKKRTAVPGKTPRGQAGLGRKVTPGQDSADAGKNAVPLLSADVRSADPGLAGQVTPEEVGRTSRNGYVPLQSLHSATPKPGIPQDFALGKVDFSDPLVGQGNTIPPPPPPPSEHAAASSQSPDLKKPSLVFVRALGAKPAIMSHSPDEPENTLSLPAGTRLVARLESPISSAIATPAVAVIEYNYERNGQIVMPAGAKVIGRLTQVDPSGYVGLQFSRIEMPDQTIMKIEGSAMDLNFAPLKGYVSGKKRGTKFLVRSLTGLGTVASYLVGPQGSSSVGLISTNALMRERLANNVATAGQDELNGLAFNQNLVVTVPGNTRFYIVLQKPTTDSAGSSSGTRNAATNTAGRSGGVPTMEELRQLLELRREINELYTHTSQAAPASPQP